MRILLVSNYQPPHMGGIEFAAGSLKRCWTRDGHEVTWLTTDVPASARPSTADNVRIRAWNGLESRFQINSPLPWPGESRRVRALIRTHDVVNIHSLAPGLSNLALRLAWAEKKPVVLTQHVAVIPLRSRLLTAYQRHHVLRLARGVVKHAGMLTFVGAAVRDWFQREACLPDTAIAMTPAGIDLDTYHFVDEVERRSARAGACLRDDALNVLFVGRFYDKKGLPLIRDVAASRPGMRFTLVGGGPVDPARWGLPNVRVVSFVTDAELRALYGAHDVFLMPSFGEGWPAVVPQAMVCGLPCIVSRECFSGYAKDADRFTVVERTVDAVNGALDRAAAALPLAETERRAISAYAAQTWDWQRTARIYAGLFESVRAGGAA